MKLDVRVWAILNGSPRNNNRRVNDFIVVVLVDDADADDDLDVDNDDAVVPPSLLLRMDFEAMTSLPSSSSSQHFFPVASACKLVFQTSTG